MVCSRKEGSYEVRVGEANVADTKMRKDNLLPAGGAMRRCLKAEGGFSTGPACFP